MSKHEVLTGVSYRKGKTTIRYGPGDTLDSTEVSKEDLACFLARGAVGAAAKVSKPKPAKVEEVV